MEQLRKLELLDEHGRPVDERTLGVLEKLQGDSEDTSAESRMRASSRRSSRRSPR